MKLSKRLQLIADVIKKYKQGTTIADIGTDHAYLPCYLVENKIVCHAYACDVAKGPLQCSKDTIKQFDLEDMVTPLLGNGLEPILDKDVSMISISGMGSYLIAEILDAHRKYLDNVDVLFLQPNSNINHLRKYLFSNGFKIVDEQLVKDTNHIYEVLVVIQSANKDICYKESDIEFGPILSANQPPLFKEKWKQQLEINKKILSSLEEEHPRYQEIQHMIDMIEGELYDRK